MDGILNANDSAFLSDQANKRNQELYGQLMWNASEQSRPFFLLKPRLMRDGNQWCFILGESPNSVEGWGDTPEKAAAAFDVEYRTGVAGPSKS